MRGGVGIKGRGTENKGWESSKISLIWFWRIALLIAVIALFPGSAAAQDTSGAAWQAGNGPIAAVTHIAADPSTPDFLMIFLAHGAQRNNDRTQATQGYLTQAWAPYFSTDGGDTWQPASNDLAHVEPTVLRFVEGAGGNTIWAGTAEHGLWRSDNSGRTWRPAIVAGLEDQRIFALTVDARKRLHLLTLDNSRYPSSHLYTSNDNGYNWSRRLLQTYAGDPATTVVDLIADPFSPNTLYAVTLGGLLVSENAGFSWRQAPLIVPNAEAADGTTVLAVDPTQRGRLYAANHTVSEAGEPQITIHRSLDSGASWTILDARFTPPKGADGSKPPVPLSLRLDPVNRNQFFLAANNGLWVSADAGMNWRMAGTALSGVSVQDVFLHPRRRGRWYAVGAGGMWRTANAGSQWRALHQGGLPPASRVQSITALSGRPRVVLAAGGGYMPIRSGTQPLWRSADGGATWMPAMNGLSGANVSHLAAHPVAGDLVYGLYSGGIVRTVNGGRSWDKLPLNTGVVDFAPGRKPNEIFIASFNGVLRSTDRGETWQPTWLAAPAQAVVVDAKGDVYAVALDDVGASQVWRSNDHGGSWEIVSAPPPGAINQFIAHPSAPGLLALALHWDGLYISPDDGRTWQRSGEGIPPGIRWRGPNPETPDGPNLLDVFIDPANPLHWWAARDGGGIYHSANGGRTWLDASADLGDNLALSFTRSADNILAGTATLGVLKRVEAPSAQDPPDEVDVRIEILWPHDYANVADAQLANLGIRVYGGRSQEAPPCAWTPNVELWMAQDADPLRRVGLAEQRRVEGHPFPFWEYNDMDVSWANDPERKIIFLARVSPNLAESHGSPWIHAADARTYLPKPPAPTGILSSPPDAVDALIRVVWPHDHEGNFVPPEQANLVNIRAILLGRDTLDVPAADDLPQRVWLIGSLNNQVGRRLASGEPRTVAGEGFSYTVYEFNNIDVSLARHPAHHWTFWLEVPDMDAVSNVWVHGIDGRTRAPRLLEPIAGCLP